MLFRLTNMNQDHLSINYKLLSIEILSKALDDICPKYVEADPKDCELEKLAAAEAQLMCGEIHLGQVLLIREKYENTWNEIVEAYTTKKSTLLAEREKAINAIKRTDNDEKVDGKVVLAEQAWEKRKRSLEQRIQARRRGFVTRVEAQKGQKYSADEVKDLRVGMESQISREIRDFEKRRELAMQKIQQTRNAYRIIERVTEKEIIFDTKLKNLERSYARQVEIYNRQWTDEDIFGAALHWFANDLSEVKLLCSNAGVPMNVCYLTVQQRLALIQYTSVEINSIVDKFKSGELSEHTIPDLQRDILQKERHTNDTSGETER